MPYYRLLTGIDYSGKRAEAGDVVGDLPAAVLPALLAAGAIAASDPPTGVPSAERSIEVKAGHLYIDGVAITPTAVQLNSAGARWLSLPPGWDDAWRAAKLASASTPAWVAFIGDSITQGLQVSDSTAKTYPELLRASLLATYPLYADFYPVANSAAYATFVGRTLAGSLPWTIGTAPMAAPSAPALSTATTGGTVLAGTYQAKVTYVNSNGETVASAAASKATTGSTSTLTITSPAAGSGGPAATGWYAYVTQAGGSTFTRQQAAGSPTAIGTNLVLTAPPTSSGATPPAANTAATSPNWGGGGAFFGGYSRAFYFDNPSATSADLVFTTPYACTAIDLLYVDFGGGSFTYNVDGGSNVTVTTTGGWSTAGGVVKRVSITGLANTTHTLNVGNVSAGANAIWVGACTYKSTAAGLGFVRHAYSGASCTDMSTIGNQSPTDAALIWQGIVPNGSGGSGTGFGFPSQPSLVVLALGINDCTGNSATSVLVSWYRRLIQSFRRGVRNCSVLVLAPLNADPTNSDGTGFGHPENWPNFIQSMKVICDTFNCAFVNVHAKWGQTPQADGMQGAGDGHPIDAGHADIANLLLSVL